MLLMLQIDILAFRPNSFIYRDDHIWLHFESLSVKNGLYANSPSVVALLLCFLKNEAKGAVPA